MHQLPATIRKDAPSQVEEVGRSLLRLINSKLHRRPAQKELADARLLLEALPLATDEFAVGKQRLQNAERYVRSSEWGAARYELRLLEGVVRRCLA